MKNKTFSDFNICSSRIISVPEGVIKVEVFSYLDYIDFNISKMPKQLLAQ